MNKDLNSFLVIVTIIMLMLGAWMFGHWQGYHDGYTKNSECTPNLQWCNAELSGCVKEEIVLNSWLYIFEEQLKICRDMLPESIKINSIMNV